MGVARNLFLLFKEVSQSDAKIVGYIGDDAFELARARANCAEYNDLFVLFGKEDSLQNTLKFGEKFLGKQGKTFTVLPWTHFSPSAPERAFDELLMEYRGSVDLTQYKDLIHEGGSIKIFISDATKEYDVWGCELTESRIESLIGQKATQIMRQETENPGVWYEFTIKHQPKALEA